MLGTVNAMVNFKQLYIPMVLIYVVTNRLGS